MIEVLHIAAADAEIIRFAEFCRARTPSGQLGMSDAWSSPKIAHQANPVEDLLAKLDPKPTWQAWANINPPGTGVGSHTHHTAANGAIPLYCLVYFPADHPAALVFPDQGLRIQPRAGLAVRFPPDAAHYVEPNHASTDRVSIAANAF